MNCANVHLVQVVPGFRVRIIPVMGTIPAIFGQIMATYVVTQLAGMPVQTEPVVNLDVEHYGLLHQRLIEREELQFGSADAVEVFRRTIYPSLSVKCLRLIDQLLAVPFNAVAIMLVSCRWIKRKSLM